MHLTASDNASSQRVITPPTSLSNCSGLTHELTAGRERAVLAFLAQRPLHTAIISGFVRDNGLDSPLNRGTFYAHWDAEDHLEGVALIGHITLVEARSGSAIAAFANVATHHRNLNKIVGEQEVVASFWNHYLDKRQVPHHRSRELLFEQRCPRKITRAICGLRLATLDDLSMVMTAHAQMAAETLGVPLLASDAEGCRLRCARRITQGRVWLLVRDGRLVFKTEVVAHTPEVIYLEGVYVDPDERGKGLGTACVTQVSRDLLAQTQILCLLTSEDNRVAQGLFRKSGFTATSRYEVVFLDP
jgi:predicted GNAT family acetyltransferase